MNTHKQKTICIKEDLVDLNIIPVVNIINNSRFITRYSCEGKYRGTYPYVGFYSFTENSSDYARKFLQDVGMDEDFCNYRCLGDSFNAVYFYSVDSLFEFYAAYDLLKEIPND
jgi:hypothetical protein